jgi:hypothetical protein
LPRLLPLKQCGIGAREALHRVSVIAQAQQSAIADLRSQVAAQSPHVDGLSDRIDRLSEIVALSEQHGVGANHTDIRTFAIKSKIAQATDPVVVIGDSITEGSAAAVLHLRQGSYQCGRRWG